MTVEVGGVYSVARADATFGVVKILALQGEADTIDARIFSARALERPVAEWFEDREPGKMDDELGVGIGVLPVTSRVFAFWEPELLFSEGVTAIERQDLSCCFGMAQPWDELKHA